MPMIRISRMNGQLVWEGEGELVQGPRAGHPTNLLADGVAIRQEARWDGEVRSRQIDISELVREVPAEYRINYYAPPLPTIGWDPSGDAWAFNIPVPEPVQLYELRAEFRPGMAEWLRRTLDEPLETPEERNTRERVRHEARLAAWRDPRVPVSELMQSGARSLYENQVRGSTPADVAEMFDLDPEVLVRVAEAARRAGEGIHALAEAFQRNEEAITSTRAEFPHDPYDYGRIYPGDRGTSRWTPPADPNEKIRSCP